MMVIINKNSKYMWDYFMKTKDQVYEKICEWLEKEVGIHRGRDSANYEITLFSDQGRRLRRRAGSTECCRALVDIHHCTTPLQSGGLGRCQKWLLVKCCNLIYLKRSEKNPVEWLPLYIIVFLQFASLQGRTGSQLLRNNILPGRRWSWPDFNRLVSNVGLPEEAYTWSSICRQEW